MAIGTYEAYIERMKKMRPNVYLNGECLDRMHCGNESGFWVMKQCYEIANDPAYADVCQVKSHVTGEIVNRCTHIHQSKADDKADLPPCGRLHAALHGNGRSERDRSRFL